MDKRLIPSIILLLVTSILILSFSLSFHEKISFDRTWTTALCSGNICRDYEVVCLEGELVSLAPLTGFVTFPENWEDIRENKELC